MMFKLLLGFFATVYAAPKQDAHADMLAWIANGAPAELSETMALAKGAEDLLTASVDQDVALILPTNKAWAKHKREYQNIKENRALGLSLLLDAAVGIANIDEVKSFRDLIIVDNLTMGGTPLIIDEKDANKVYFAKYNDNGELVKAGGSIKINSKPVKKFPRVIVFEATSFSMPPSVAAR